MTLLLIVIASLLQLNTKLMTLRGLYIEHQKHHKQILKSWQQKTTKTTTKSTAKTTARTNENIFCMGTHHTEHGMTRYNSQSIIFNILNLNG